MRFEIGCAEQCSKNHKLACCRHANFYWGTYRPTSTWVLPLSIPLSAYKSYPLRWKETTPYQGFWLETFASTSFWENAHIFLLSGWIHVYITQKGYIFDLTMLIKQKCASILRYNNWLCTAFGFDYMLHVYLWTKFYELREGFSVVWINCWWIHSSFHHNGTSEW